MSNMKNNNFLSYINTTISKEAVLFLYSSNNIKIEKCGLFNDFVQSLFRLVFDTYLGDDVTDLHEQINHFNWCWKKNKNNFIEEGLSFDDEKAYDYFLEFMLEVYYTTSDKNEDYNSEKNILKLWEDIFSYDNTKTNADMDTLIEIYIILDKSLNKVS